MKDPRFLLKLNFRIIIFLFALVILFVSPLIVFFDSNAVFVFIGAFCFSICLMSYWIYEDGKKIEQLMKMLNAEKAKQTDI